MNERIRQLLYKARVETGAELGYYSRDAEIRFAELIVRECAKLIDAEESQSSYGDMLKQHFGMEEE